MLAAAAALIALILFAWLSHWITRRLLVRSVRRIAAHTTVKWDDALVGHRMFRHLSQVVPALILYFGVGVFSNLPDNIAQVLQNVAVAYGVLFVVLAAGALLNALNAIYDEMPVSRVRPIKGFIQIGKIIIYGVGAILVLASVVDRSPLLFFSGLVP